MAPWSLVGPLKPGNWTCKPHIWSVTVFLLQTTHDSLAAHEVEGIYFPNSKLFLMSRKKCMCTSCFDPNLLTSNCNKKPFVWSDFLQCIIISSSKWTEEILRKDVRRETRKLKENYVLRWSQLADDDGKDWKRLNFGIQIVIFCVNQFLTHCNYSLLWLNSIAYTGCQIFTRFHGQKSHLGPITVSPPPPPFFLPRHRSKCFRGSFDADLCRAVQPASNVPTKLTVYYFIFDIFL